MSKCPEVAHTNCRATVTRTQHPWAAGNTALLSDILCLTAARVLTPCCMWPPRTLTQLLRGKWKVQAPRRWGGFFRNDADHRDFTAIGTAAGKGHALHRMCLLRCQPAASARHQLMVFSFLATSLSSVLD